VIRTLDSLTTRTPTITQVPSTRPAALCPDHDCVLDGGPVQYRCPEGHAVHAADLDREVTR